MPSTTSNFPTAVVPGNDTGYQALLREAEGHILIANVMRQTVGEFWGVCKTFFRDSEWYRWPDTDSGIYPDRIELWHQLVFNPNVGPVIDHSYTFTMPNATSQSIQFYGGYVNNLKMMMLQRLSIMKLHIDHSSTVSAAQLTPESSDANLVVYADTQDATALATGEDAQPKSVVDALISITDLCADLKRTIQMAYSFYRENSTVDVTALNAASDALLFDGTGDNGAGLAHAKRKEIIAALVALQMNITDI